MRLKRNALFNLGIGLCFMALVFSPVSAQAEETYKFERMWPTLHQPWYFGDVEGITVDRDGFVYVADMYSHCIRKFTSDGHLVARWGSHGKGEGEFDTPNQVAIDDKNGWLYVVERYNNRVQKFTLDGEFQESWGEAGNGDEEFCFPRRIAVDEFGNVYVSDSCNYRIQKFDSDGKFLGKWGTKGEGEGEFLSPRGIAFDSQGYIYVADAENNCIQKFDPKDGFSFLKRYGNEEGEDEIFHAPNGIVIDKDDFIYIANEGDDSIRKFELKEDTLQPVGRWGGEGASARKKLEDRINKVIEDSLEAIKTYRINLRALNDLVHYLPGGVEDGEFKTPRDIAVDRNGHVYVADTGNQRIQKLDSEGEFLAKWTGIDDRNGAFQSPLGIAVFEDELIYVADSGNHRIQKFGRKNGEFLESWGGEGDKNGEFVFPTDVATDSEGNVYVADALNFRIQKFDADGSFEAAWGSSAIENGQLDFGKDKFVLPVGVTVQGDYLYVADLGGNRIHKFDLEGERIKIWSAQAPARIAIDSIENVYTVNQDCNCVQKFGPDGTRVEDWEIKLAEDSEITGPAVEYAGLAIKSDSDGKDYLYVSTGEYNFRIWKFLLETDKDEATFVTQISEPGPGIGQVIFPAGIDVDENGRVYAADTGNHRIQVFREGQGTDKKMSGIIVAGRQKKEDENTDWGMIQASANFAYQALTYQGFTPESIYYLSSNKNLDLDGNGEPDVDAPATKEDLRIAIQLAATDAEDIVIYLVDHGGVGEFHMNENEDGILYASELNTWLNEIEVSGKVIVIYEACHSGSFLESLKEGRNRIVITSSSSEESSWLLSGGAVSFSNYFWTEVFNGENLEDVFLTARKSTTDTIDDQTPLIDDNGDGVYEEDKDGGVARNTYIGNGTIVSGDAPVIAEVSPEQTIEGTTTTATFFADGVSDNDGIDWVRAFVRSPNYMPPSDGKLATLPSFDLKPIGNGRYEGSYEHFGMSGTYLIAIYAKDSLGNTSPPQVTKVTVEEILKRRAIIAWGDYLSSDVKTVLPQLALQAYNALRTQGYDDQDIYFMGTETASLGIDGATTFDNLEYAINTWATESQDLVLYLLGKSEIIEDGNNSFLITDNPDIDEIKTLSPQLLDEWLDNLQDKILGKVTFIYDACHSGSFIPLLTPPDGQERILIASTDKEEPVHFLSVGGVSFSKYFWRGILGGKNIHESFVDTQRIILHLQNPQIDDNANGIGNEAKKDGRLAASYFIGLGMMQANTDRLIRNGSPSSLTLADGDKVWVEPTKAGDDSLTVWAIVNSPSDAPDGSVCSITTLGDRKQSLSYRDGRYELEYDGFSDEGEYVVTIYAQDEDGNESDPVSIKVCVGDADEDGIGDCWDSTPYGIGEGWLDSDGDGVLDSKDAFPHNPDEQYDSDGDGIGDHEDPDDDNDEIPDKWEDFYNTDPLDSSDFPEDTFSPGSGSCNAAKTMGMVPPVSASASGDSDSFLIAGRITEPNKRDVEGIVLEGGPNPDVEIRTNDNGYFHTTVPAGWEGTLRPVSSDFVFMPSKLSYKDVRKDFFGQNFQAIRLPKASDYESCPPTIESFQDGYWDDPNTWKQEQVPEKNDIVRINAGHTVIFNPSDRESWSTYTENDCKSGSISDMKKGNEIKALCNLGTLVSEQHRDIALLASDFIYNKGKILGADGYHATSIPGVPIGRRLGKAGGQGRNIILTAKRLFYNAPNGEIQGGRGGDHHGNFSTGGDGGSVEIYGPRIFNEGSIGPRCGSESPNSVGGNGGNASTPSGDSTSCNDSFGGNGGNTILLADSVLVNLPGAWVSSGKGGSSAYGHCNGYGGKEGDIVFTGVTATVQNGTIQGCGPGTAISCDPPDISLNGGKMRGRNITISGGNCSIIDLKGLDENAISGAENIIIAVGEGGIVDLRELKKGVLNGEQVDIYADNILKDDCVNLENLIPNLTLHPSKIIYDFSMSILVRQAPGTTDDFVYIPVFLLNNSPEADSYEVEVRDGNGEGHSLHVIGDDLDDHAVSVGAFKYKVFCLQVRLPDESDQLVLELTSNGNPDLVKYARVGIVSEKPPPDGPDSDSDGLTDAEEKEIGIDPNAQDSDDDGMKDGYEYLHGLDPFTKGDNASKDTDGDAFTDFEEYLAYTDPHNALSKPNSNRPLDRDNDGLPDLIEEEYGTDPEIADTDGDGLSDAWEVYHELNPLTENQVGKDSDDDGFSDLDEFVSGTDPYDELSIPAESPKDRDEDGLPDIMENLWGSDPDDPDSDKDGRNDKWAFHEIEYSKDADEDGLPDILEIMYGTDPDVSDFTPGTLFFAEYPEDSDSDGLPDVVEENKYGTAPDSPDTDEDGMTDGWEIYHGLKFDENDSEADTDSDGFSNIEEFKARTKPNDASSMPDSHWPKDSDNDGLPDILETDVYGTDPENPDSDGDGMTDGWEVWNGLEPSDESVDDASQDLDEDGLTNFEEYENGTDPNNSDTDGDGMADKWEIDNHLNPFEDDAAEDPDEDGVSNLEEFDADSNPYDLVPPDEYPVFASVTYRPKDADKDGLPDVVEEKIGTRRNNADSDGDGMNDTWEVLNGLDLLDPRKGLNPLDPSDASEDLDNDGFSNIEEYKAGTYPDDETSLPDEYPADADGDGLPDVVEEYLRGEYGTDPDNADSDGDGMEDGWEFFNALDPSDPGDADQDPEEDGLTHLDEFLAGTNPHCLSFQSGDFIVGDEGLVKLDWLYDGGAYKGEFGIFSLKDMEELSIDEFVREAIRRVMLNEDRVGHIVFSDPEEAARFMDEREEGGLLSGEKEEWNYGDYKGTKGFRMTPRDHIATILIPNYTFKKVTECWDLPGDKNCLKGMGSESPLFSLVFPNTDYGMHLGQMADVSDMGKAFVYEDINLKHSACDRDYNDLIVQISGVVKVDAPSLDSLDKGESSGKRGKRNSDGEWLDWRTETELGRRIMEHIDAMPQPGEKRIVVEFQGPADLFVYDSQGRVLGKEGGNIPGSEEKIGWNIPGASFELASDGRQLITLPTSADENFRIVLHGTGDGDCSLIVTSLQDKKEVSLGSESIAIQLRQIFKMDVSLSSSSVLQSCGEHDFDCNGIVDDDDINRVNSIWNACKGDEDYDAFYDWDDDSCITVADIMPVANPQ